MSTEADTLCRIYAMYAGENSASYSSCAQHSTVVLHVGHFDYYRVFFYLSFISLIYLSKLTGKRKLRNRACTH